MHFWPTWIALVTAHALLALIPFAIHQSKVTALIPYWSYFGVLSVLNDVGLKVFADFSEGVFMAPVSALGNVLVALFWLFVHAGIAAVLTSASKNFALFFGKGADKNDA